MRSLAPPGHQNGRGATNDLKKLLGAQAFKGDATTQKGIDDRRESTCVRQDAERLAAEA